LWYYDNMLDVLCMIDSGILRLNLICFYIICDWFQDNMLKIREFYGEIPMVVL